MKRQLQHADEENMGCNGFAMHCTGIHDLLHLIDHTYNL
jgi:hypothetical protein